MDLSDNLIGFLPTVSNSMDLSGNLIGFLPFAPTPEPMPDVLTLADLMDDHAVVVAKESSDKSLLETIGVQNVSGLKPVLVEWFMKGCPNAYPILSLNIQPPTKCSDGVVRSLSEYIEFCSEKPIQDHVALLQVKLPDMVVSFANIGGNTTIVVSKA